jgi:hypothetical protein
VYTEEPLGRAQCSPYELEAGEVVLDIDTANIARLVHHSLRRGKVVVLPAGGGKSQEGGICGDGFGM